MTSYWVSWYGNAGPWTLNWPWWISGYRLDGDEAAERPDTPTVCAAVQAESEDAAKDIILSAHDVRPMNLEWRFVEEQAPDWTPFNDRFPRAVWMQWPNNSNPEQHP